MLIEELAKKYANAIPNSQIVKYYEAAIPQYCMELILTMQKEKPLSILEEFILKFVCEDINEIDIISEFLGLNKSTVYSAIANMQTLELISIDIFNSKIKIKDEGKKALKACSLVVPEDIEYKVFMDALTGNIYLDSRSKYTKKDVKNLELSPIRPFINKPDINDINFEDIKSAINSFRKVNSFEKDKLDGNLLSISELQKVYIEYNKVSVLVYMNKKTEDVELRMYEKQTRCQDYENILLQMLNNNTRIFEFDYKKQTDDISDYSLLNILPSEIINSAEEYSQKSNDFEREISQLKTQLTDMKDQFEENKNNEENETSTQRIKYLEQKIKEMESEHRSADRVLSTYEHRPLLIQALKEAKNVVIIISPWIKASGLNNEIIGLIDQALRRNTKIIIGYGISEKEDSDKWIIDKLNVLRSKNYGNNLNLISLNNTHEKLLIMDNKFMVITSFNWLSFKGDPTLGFRQETGYYTESKESISEMKKNLSRPQRLGIELKEFEG